MERAARRVAQKTKLPSCSRNLYSDRESLHPSFLNRGNTYLHPHRWQTCSNRWRLPEETTASIFLHPLNTLLRSTYPSRQDSFYKHSKQFFHLSHLHQDKRIEKMSDESYMKFLEDANKVHSFDGTTGKPKLKNLDHDADVPEVLREAINDAYYVSEVDEPFLPVALRVENGFPDAESFAKLVHHPNPTGAGVKILKVIEWDRHGQYGEIVDAVNAAVQHNAVQVYRVEISSASSEYWIVGVRDSFMLGVKALSIET
ncbi:hypothetical protein GcC1_131012 [Golovinomyces cichoracearum]|uniref:Uncharacterized protein n=1 Tax=Golovinomyces cichoracearum TaxID=62708 RepID=A0A420I4G7_9PEZI|nr:hypothetical protein GcC1_131012 [Golovinomyces cichoracearum]